jgi:response regulator RpfG family c-di-GMP phosphodiesterase
MNRNKVVYYIDDCYGDREWVLEELGGFTIITHDGNPTTWMDFVSHTGEFKDNPPPDIIVTDANLHHTFTGFDVAMYVHENKLCDKIVVCSGVDPDSQALLQDHSYKTNITAFLVKPVTKPKVEVILERSAL